VDTGFRIITHKRKRDPGKWNWVSDQITHTRVGRRRLPLRGGSRVIPKSGYRFSDEDHA
jgi:hypothetical protein